MVQSDGELLHLYANDHSEEAFTELVERHINIVHAAALRQLGGDGSLAEEVTQRVFSELAGKAILLTGRTSIVGWLYGSTRFCALAARRAEMRRRKREQEAYMMEQTNHSSPGSDQDWTQLSAVLDETMHELGKEDREAVLLRYFKGCSLKEVGDCFGVSDNAARMRVDRALDKLRLLLAKRGVLSTTAVLAVLFTSFAAPAAPRALAGRIAKTALTGSIATGTIAGFWVMRTGTKILLGLAAAIILVVFVPLTSSWREKSSLSLPGPKPIAPAAQKVPVASPANDETNAGTNVPATPPAAASPTLALKLIDSRSGKPVTGVKVDCFLRPFNPASAHFVLTVDKMGTVEVPYPSNTTRLQLITRRERYADTRLDFDSTGGAKIPASYTLSLEPGVVLGGSVVDADGQPAGNAHILWNHYEAPEIDHPPVSHQFSSIEVEVDASGRWEVNRIAEDMVRRLRAFVRLGKQVAGPEVWTRNQPEVERELRAGTFVFHLGRSSAIGGDVRDANGQAIAGAEVLVGTAGSPNRQVGKVSSDGTFRVIGGESGAEVLTATAPGFASSSIVINSTNDPPPYHLVLQPAKTARLKVVSPAGDPVANAKVRLNPNGSVNRKMMAQVEFSATTESDGLVVWTNAPEGDLRFEITAHGHIMDYSIVIPADGTEHVAVLPRPVIVTGTVREAGSGGFIPEYHIIKGVPSPLNPDPTFGLWSQIEANWEYFSKSDYSVVFDSLMSMNAYQDAGYILKFEADGYETFVSRIIRSDEGKVSLDVALKRSLATIVTVVSSQGQPMADIQVGLACPSALLRLVPGGLESRAGVGRSLIRTDRKGQFSLPPDPTITRVVVASPEGFTQAIPADLKKNTILTVLPWGRVEGTCLADGKIAPGRKYIFQLIGTKNGDCLCDYKSYEFISDDLGHFVLPTAPPGRHRIIHLRHKAAPTGSADGRKNQETEIEVKPGQTTIITLNDEADSTDENLRAAASGK